MFLSRVMAAIGLKFDEKLTIRCDNTNTLRLVKNDSLKLTTALRHVDIHNHWLRQEYREGRIDFQWVQTASMEADGMTKCLSGEKHRQFQRMIHVEDLESVLPPPEGDSSTTPMWDGDLEGQTAILVVIRDKTTT